MRKSLGFLAGLLLALFAVPALAQSNPGLYTGQVPSAAQWNSYFSGKENFPAGYYVATAAPASPYVGQIWANTTGNPVVVAQYDGAQWVTIGLLNTSGHSWTSPGATFATTTAMLAAYPSGVTPPPVACTVKRDSNSTSGTGGACFYYDSAILAPFTITGTITVGIGCTYLDATAVSGGTINVGDYVTGTGVGAGAVITANSSSSRSDCPSTGTGGTGNYQLYPTTATSVGSETLTITADNLGTLRIDNGYHGWRLQQGQRVAAELWPVYPYTDDAVGLQYALSDLNMRTCIGGASTTAAYGAYDNTLWFSSSLVETTKPLFVGLPDAGHSCGPAMRIQGTNTNSGSAQGVIRAALPGQAVLEWSGLGNFTLDNFSINNTGTNGVGCWGSQIASSATNLDSGSQASTTLQDHAQCVGQFAGAIIQASDLSYIDPTSDVSGSGSNSGTPYSLVLGGVMPYAPYAGSFGQAQGGSTTTIQLVSGASAVDGTFVGDPIEVTSTTAASGECTGSVQLGYITGYVGSTTTATISGTWPGFTPTSSSCYYIAAIGSTFQNYAGFGGQGGCTSYKIGGQFQGPILWTGCDTGNGILQMLGAQYNKNYGNPSSALILDGGNVSCPDGQKVIWSGINTEAGNANEAEIWLRGMWHASVSLDGRADLGGTTPDALFRANSTDAGSVCGLVFANDAPFSSVDVKTNSLTGGVGAMFDVTPTGSGTLAVESFTLDDHDNASVSLGSFNSGLIGNCNIIWANVTAATFQPKCRNLLYEGLPVAAGAAPVASGTCTAGTQTGGNTAGTIVLTCSSQSLTLTFATTQPTGWNCNLKDQTTPADTLTQTSSTTTSCTFSSLTTASADVARLTATAY